MDPFLIAALGAFAGWLFVNAYTVLSEHRYRRSQPPSVRALNARIEALEHELEITQQREEQAKYQHNDEVRALKAGQMLMAAAAKSKPLVRVQQADPISENDLRELRTRLELLEFQNHQYEVVNEHFSSQIAALSVRLHGVISVAYSDDCMCGRCYALRSVIGNDAPYGTYGAHPTTTGLVRLEISRT